MRIDNTLKNTFYNNGIYDAWQFVENTSRTLYTAQYCKDTIGRLISGMQQEHDQWREDLLNKILSEENEIAEISLSTESFPTYNTSIVNKDISSRFLIDKLIKDFFQYTRNAFDSMSQIANVALLGVKAKKVDSVDFPAMLKVFNQLTYSQDFPEMMAWYNKISADPAYLYIDAFNNRTKHTCDIYLKIAMDFLGKNHALTINPFYRKDNQHEKKDIVGYLNEIYDFVVQAFDDFMEELKKEYPKKLYIYNRYNTLMVEQQKMTGHPESDFAVVYMESESDISAMPEEIEVLLLNRCDNGEIYCKNCDINTILVKKKGTERDYIGRYLAIDETCRDDTLLCYRKYRKDIIDGNLAFIKTTFEWRAASKKHFYHWNPYMTITTRSDDEWLLTRSQLTF